MDMSNPKSDFYEFNNFYQINVDGTKKQRKRSPKRPSSAFGKNSECSRFENIPNCKGSIEGSLNYKNIFGRGGGEKYPMCPACNNSRGRSCGVHLEPEGRPVSQSSRSMSLSEPSNKSVRSILCHPVLGSAPTRICSSSCSKYSKKEEESGRNRESIVRRFDRLVDEELRRRRDSFQVMLEPITSDPDLLQAVDHYIRAENIDTFTGAVRAAEAAAAKAQPDQIEEAAVQGARGFQAEVIDVIEETVPGWIPIKVIGYVGITRPKHPVKSTCKK